MNIFVGNLSFLATENDVKGVFEAFGAVSSVSIKKKSGKNSRGFGFVSMPDELQAQAAIAGLQNKEFMGRPLSVSIERPKVVKPKKDYKEIKRLRLEAKNKPLAVFVAPIIPEKEVKPKAFRKFEKEDKPRRKFREEAKKFAQPAGAQAWEKEKAGALPSPGKRNQEGSIRNLNTRDDHRMRYPFLLIFCLGFFVYSNTFHCSFAFDDDYYIVNNFFIKNIQNLQNIWVYYPCRFITFLSFALNYHFHQLNVFGYHFFNLAVHLCTAFFVWWLVLLTLSTPVLKDHKISQHAGLMALFAGLFFVSHPLQTEAVTYISQRAACLAAFFYLASLCFYVQSRLLNFRKSYYIGSLVLGLMAMFTKENAITLPLMILLYEISFLNTERKINWRFLAPFLFLMLIIPTTMLLSGSKLILEVQGIAQAPGGISPWHYLLTQFRVMVTYVRLVFLPFNQNLDYDYPVFKSVFEFPVLISFLFLMSVLFWAKRLYSKYRLVSFSIFWFFLTLLPESSLLTENDVIFEHRLYLPLAGFSIFIASGMYYLIGPQAGHSSLFGKNNLKLMVAALLLVIACNSVLTYQRNNIWRDNFSLWDDTVGKSPHKARPHNNRGKAYVAQGRIKQGISDFNKAIEINPDYADAYNNRGATYDKLGNFTQAISDYNKAIGLDPNKAEIYTNRGIIYGKQGNFTQAISEYSKAVNQDPNQVEDYINRGIIYYDHGYLVKAMSDFNKALELSPQDEKAYNDRGLVFFKQGDINGAISDFSKAIEINPNYAKAYVNRGIVEGQVQDFKRAVEDFTVATVIDPKYVDAYRDRAVGYFELKKYDKAWANVHKVEELGSSLDPRFIKALKQVSGQQN